MKKPLEAVIEDVIIEPEKIQPIIVNFQNGNLKDNETKKITCGVYNDQKKNKTVLAMSNGQVVYKGYRPDLNKELTYTMLAIHNKKTGKIRLIQAERWAVAPVLDEQVNSKNDDEVDKVAELNKEFGSKKVKRRTEQYERMKINVDNVKEQLEKTVSNVEIEKSDLEPVGKDDFIESVHLPPCNRDAATVSDIYNIEDIVPKNILKTLYTQAVEVAESEATDKTDFFVKTIALAKNDPKCAVKIAMLLYMDAVVFWLKTHMKDVKKDLVVCPYSTDVNTYVMETYSMVGEKGSKLRPTSMRDKGIIHCLILALTIWNFTLDLELFSTMFPLRLGIKKLLELSKYICATPIKDDKKTIVLKLPLPAPVSKPLKKRNQK